MVSKRRLRIATTGLVVTCLTWSGMVAAAAGQTEGDDVQLLEPVIVDGRFHSGTEIIRLVHQSVLWYSMSLLDSVVADSLRADVQTINPSLIRIETGTSLTLGLATLEQSVADGIDIGNKLYGDKDYQRALYEYLALFVEAPESHVLATMIGNTFWSLKQDDSAVAWLERALVLNPISYQAHWFLADALMRLGKTEEALRHITRAHLYNRNHQDIERRMVSIRKEIGRPWRKWEFRPVYRISKDGYIVSVEAERSSQGYGLVKAIWAYEPGYAEKMTKPGYVIGGVNLLEEQEAINAIRSYLDSTCDFQKIVHDGFLDAFSLYEVISRRYPRLLLVLSDGTINRIEDYLDKYH